VNALIAVRVGKRVHQSSYGLTTCTGLVTLNWQASSAENSEFAAVSNIMSVIVSSKDELIVPRSVRRKAGIKTGDRVEFKVSGGVINIIPKLPAADDEYTPAERLAIDARLAEARKGPYYGPFETADDAVKFLRREIKVRKAKER
jgi:bifunctional DNA-binding transcriptional regulator/antitoxin component of YhaV-PrlF toxin-antitoxin module